MRTGLISKSVSVGKKAAACWPGAQSVAKEQHEQITTKAEKKQVKNSRA